MIAILNADARHIPLADESVNCVVTSPPYWGLRDYGTAAWKGGDSGCDHRVDTEHQRQGATSQRAGRSNVEIQRNENFRSTCGKCGADRADAQIGLERTPEEYVAAMVAVFREVRRVLRKDGTVWLNLGDSYCSTAPGTGGDPIHRRGIFSGVSERRAEAARKYRPETPHSLKPKDLVGIPWRVAFALQADGWWLRSDIVWSKPNPMPESVTSRPTRSHEYLFLLAKSATYYYDAEAISERLTTDVSENYPARAKIIGRGGLACLEQNATPQQRSSGGLPPGKNGRRNRRSVWTIATSPYPGAHFATFPPKLVEPCILAGCPRGGTVMDPFAGSGTVGRVAIQHGRSAVLLDLNAEYLTKQADRRTRDVQIEAPLHEGTADGV